MAFHPYLFFGGNCRQAMTRYHEILGGDLALVTTADMPPEEQMPGASSDAIMHAALTLADGSLLMASDDPTAENLSVQGMQVNYAIGDEGEAKRVFDALSEGGQVNLPIGPTSWSPMFGMVVDQFGTPWMVSAEPPAA